MRCSKCHLCEHSISQVIPSGSSSPDVYFITSKPDEEDSRYGKIFEGSRGNFFKSFLSSLNITNYRIFSMVRCVPYNVEYVDPVESPNCEYVDSTDRQPTESEINCCSEYLLDDIKKSSPKLIVALGTEALHWITKDNTLKITKSVGKLSKIKLGDTEYDFMPVYSPTYIIHNKDNQDIVSKFFEDLKKVKQISDGTYIDVMKENKMYYAMTYSDFKKFYLEELRGEPELAYDIETNATLIFEKQFDIIGFSLAKKRCGIYVCLKSLDMSMSEQEVQACKQLLVYILSTTKTIDVHNCMYERPATIYNLHYDIPYDNLDDTLVMAKMMLGGKIGAGLKPNAQRIGYPAWDDDLDEYIDKFTTITKRLKLVKYQPLVEEMRQGHSLYEILKSYDNDFEVIKTTFSETDKQYKDKKKIVDKYEEIHDYIDDIVNVVESYYEDNEIQGVMSLVSNKIIEMYDHGIPGAVIPYSWIPGKMIRKYGATDALATFDLKEYYLQKFKEESTDEVDLYKGYKYALMEHYVGHCMVMAGMKWDDDAAEEDYHHYSKICIHSLKYMFTHPSVQEFVVDEHAEEYLPEVIYEFYNDYIWDNFKVRIVSMGQDDNGIPKFKLEYEENDKIKSKHIKWLNDMITLPESISNDCRKKVLDKILDEVKKADNVEEMKYFFNPASTVKKVQELANKILIVDNTRFCKFLKEAETPFTADDFDIEKQTDKDKLFFKLFDAYKKTKYKTKERELLYNKLNAIYNSGIRFDNEGLQEAVGISNSYELNGMDDTSQIDVFESLIMGLNDQDDPSTWNTEMKWLFFLRSYKKAYKIISAYIEGNVGRGSVYVVEKDKLENGEDISYRLRNYYDCTMDENNRPILGPNETFLEQTNFHVMSAETGRWRSAYHVVPTGSSIKKLYRSRFKGGTIFQPDFSANELRCVASYANEESMQKAFAEGQDIHKANAARVYGVPYDEVTKFQRRFAKMISFSLLYGASAYSIADRVFGGDLHKAQKMLDDFFNAFPKLKDWIESKHQEVLKTHKVSVLTDRFIKIDFDPNDKKDVSRALRQSSNYPVQSSASTVAAVIFCLIVQYMRSHHMKSKPICFIHDSLESDIYPYELLEMISVQKKHLAEDGKKLFNLILKADVSMGVSMGDECELSEVTFLDDKFTKADITLEGYKDELHNLIEQWSSVYHKVEVVEESYDKEFIHMSQFFIPRKAYDPTIWSHRENGKVKIHIEYYNDKGEIEPMKEKPNLLGIWHDSPMYDFIVSH